MKKKIEKLDFTIMTKTDDGRKTYLINKTPSLEDIIMKINELIDAHNEEGK